MSKNRHFDVKCFETPEIVYKNAKIKRLEMKIVLDIKNTQNAYEEHTRNSIEIVHVKSLKFSVLEKIENI